MVSQLRRRRGLATAALLVLLALAATTPAMAGPWQAESGFSAWKIAVLDLWAGFLVRLGAGRGNEFGGKVGSQMDPHGEPAAPPPEVTEFFNKEGSSMDPDGRPSATLPGVFDEEGSMMDPHG